MKNILYINACCRENSRTDELARHLLSILSGNVQSVNLYKENIIPLNSQLLLKRDSLLKQGRTDDKSFALARQFASADIIVISAPYWDLMFPSVLKVYLENITACGVTFRYSDKGIPESLCKAESLYYVTSSGGYISENNFGFDYIRALATGFFGITDVKFFSAQGLDIYGADVNCIMQKAKEDMFLQFDKNI